MQKSKIANLQLFTNRFKAIAENMGAILQRTAFSVNVKQRLDFSCALLDSKGELIANAPHIPVHLGSLGLCARKILAEFKLEKGDTIVTNHPKYGGSHLPDITLLTPAFSSDNKLIGFVINRAHHSEIGGIRPGSMPPNAKNLAEEGVVIAPFYLIKNGKSKWKSIEKILRKNKYPSRNIEENLADLNAGLAANQNGVLALQNLVEKQGFESVQFYMEALKNHAKEKMQETLQKIPDGNYKAQEFLDDGTPLFVQIKIKKKSCKISFQGSGAVHSGNLNANDAIVNSVVIYVLRLLLDEDLPLNDGILKAVEIDIPEETLLNPYFDENPEKCPAVVGGNVETSQRLTDLLLKAFGILACSQGTMNNVLFGNENFGYYETIGGGCGAGKGFDGASAVHHHMTNTKITDPEVLEHYYPVRLKVFNVRKNSGGKGKQKGGDGIIRKILFLEPVELSVLTQHRKEKPYGLYGGKAGKKGKQFIIRKNGKKEKLKGIDGTQIQKGDLLVIKTPGGGGFGKGNY